MSKRILLLAAELRATQTSMCFTCRGTFYLLGKHKKTVGGQRQRLCDAAGAAQVERGLAPVARRIISS